MSNGIYFTRLPNLISPKKPLEIFTQTFSKRYFNSIKDSNTREKIKFHLNQEFIDKFEKEDNKLKKIKMIKELPSQIITILGHQRFSCASLEEKCKIYLARLKIIFESRKKVNEKYTEQVQWYQWIYSHVGLNCQYVYNNKLNENYIGIIPDKSYNCFILNLFKKRTFYRYTNLIEDAELHKVQDKIYCEILDLISAALAFLQCNDRFDDESLCRAKILEFKNNLYKLAKDKYKKFQKLFDRFIEEFNNFNLNFSLQSINNKNVSKSYYKLISFYQKKEIELESKGIIYQINNRSYRRPWTSVTLPIAGARENISNNLIYFGIHRSALNLSLKKLNNYKESYPSRESLYFKTFSQKHNCIGYVASILKSAGANIFKPNKLYDSKFYKISNPTNSFAYLGSMLQNINDLNQKCYKLLKTFDIENHDIQLYLEKSYLLNNFDINNQELINTIASYNNLNTLTTNKFSFDALKLLKYMVEYCANDKFINVYRNTEQVKYFIANLLLEIRRVYHKL